ncbi:MAG TPA: nicotinate-nucleotide adenylyltransferase [Pyrinomonadaceae bacterium]|nr:nicotinate-nucleotide adenylyltransferase [Pyrinomonadaceae bacterium]
MALYGGTFDPVHAGHLAVARNLAELFALDEVLFVPAHVAPHKRHVNVSPALDRYAMLALATQDEPAFRVSSVELDAPERPYTVETVAHFKERFGASSRLFFVMGADSWAEIKSWREWERLLSMAEHLVVTRPGYEISDAHVTEEIRARVVDVRGREESEVALSLEDNSGATRIYLTDAASVRVSSTEIRRALAGDGDGAANLGALLPPPVAAYIEKYRLYRDTHERELTDTTHAEH